jgi:hypothetical protein
MADMDQADRGQKKIIMELKSANTPGNKLCKDLHMAKMQLTEVKTELEIKRQNLDQERELRKNLEI